MSERVGVRMCICVQYEIDRVCERESVRVSVYVCVQVTLVCVCGGGESECERMSV